MPVITTPSDEYDVIICGGGATACAIAARLSMTGLSILVLEAGANNINNPTVTRPGAFRVHMHPNSTTSRRHCGESESQLDGRCCPMSVANVLGGGSSINFMMYTRGSWSDYDSWGYPEWQTQALLPYFRRLETCWYGGADSSTHGFEGPISVSYGGHSCHQVIGEFLEAAKKLGFPIVDDPNDLKVGCGFARWAKYIDPVTGQRQDSAHKYIHSVPAVATAENLHILCNATVDRVIFTGNRVTGIVYIPSGSNSPELTIRSRRLTIISAGALSTPQILERSGVGNPTHLSSFGIPTVIPLPGVGENLQDHNLLFPVYRVTPDIDTHDAIFTGLPTNIPPYDHDIDDVNARGQWSSNAMDVAGKVRPQKPADIGPVFARDVWDSEFSGKKSDRPVVVIVPINGFTGDRTAIEVDKTGERKYIIMGVFTCYPQSRGRIHISSRDVSAPPKLETGFLTHEADVETLHWGYKLTRQLMKNMPMYVEDEPSCHPADESAESVRKYMKKSVATTWHMMGTCAMGEVVDEKLKVIGAEALMCADLSICPGNVGANTYNTALMIGEKAAVLAAEYLGFDIAPKDKDKPSV